MEDFYNHNELEAGDIVVVNAGGANADCVLLQLCGSKAILFPIKLHPEFQAAISHLPVNGTIKTKDEVEKKLCINSTASMPVLVGELKTGSDPHKRHFYRITFDFPVHMSSDGKVWSTIQGKNISEGGMLLGIREPLSLQIGQPAVFVIRIPECQPIKAAGVVKRIIFANPEDGGNQIGVQFTNIPGDDSRRLAQFIRNFQLQMSRYKVG